MAKKNFLEFQITYNLVINYEEKYLLLFNDSLFWYFKLQLIIIIEINIWL